MEATQNRGSALDLLTQAEQFLAAAAAGGPGAVTELPDAQLLAVAELAGSVQRLSDAVMVAVSHAVEQQCRTADAEASLAARHGMRDHTTLLMALTGASRHTLRKYRRVAISTCPRGVGSTGVLPAALPDLAAALTAGAIGLDQALVIRDTLTPTGSRAHPDALATAERALVAAATGAPDPFDDSPVDEATGGNRVPSTPDLLAVQARAWRDAIDPDGPEPAYDEQRRRRSFTLGQRPDGMWAGKVLLPADQGAALRLALDAHNAPRAQTRHDDSSDDPEEHAPGEPLARRGLLDDRSTAQRQADTLVGLITRAMELTDAPRIGGEAATVVVTITEAELAEHGRTGGGTARLEHTGETVPAHVAARIICDGYLQACLLGEDGLPLKLGRSRRTHTRHQRKAILTAYPGGCQNPDCDAPPGFTEIHHPIWWSRDGNTDADNGVPLCQHCHTELHAGRLRCLREPEGRWTIRPSFPLRPRYRRRPVTAA